jgi:hypothetical protein
MVYMVIFPPRQLPVFGVAKTEGGIQKTAGRKM